jgi:hypothetical protein
MSLEKTIAAAIEKAAKRTIPVLITEGIVSVVDRAKRTCNVTREGLPELLNVRLNSISEPGKNVITIYPKKGSAVLCALVENQQTDCVVISANKIEELAGEISGLKLSWTRDGIIINDGNNGGLTITPELRKQLDRNSARIDNVIEILKTSITSVSLQPNPAWVGIVTPLLEALQKEDYSGIENKKVKH